MESLILWMGLIITLIINFLPQYTDNKCQRVKDELFERQLYKRRRVRAIVSKVGDASSTLQKEYTPKINSNKVTETKEYTMSEVTENELKFFDTLSAEIYNQTPFTRDEAVLSVDDLNEVEESPPAYDYFEESSLLNQKIADEKLGMQIWRVSVVGMEGEFLHVYDGTKTWIRVDQVSQYRQHDIIDVVINYSSSNIEVIQVQSIYRVSEDYVIPDEYTG